MTVLGLFGAMGPFTAAAAAPSCAKVLLFSPRLVTLRMDETWVHDDRAEGVYYMKAEERALHRVHVGPNGILTRADGTVLDTQGQRSIFVMDADRNIYTLDPRHPIRGRLHHSTFLAGDAISAGGSLIVQNGRIIYVDNGSGHYSPPAGMLAQLRETLSAYGVPLDGIQYRDYRKQAVTPHDLTPAEREEIETRNLIYFVQSRAFKTVPEEQRAKALVRVIDLALTQQKTYMPAVWKFFESIWKSDFSPATIEAVFLRHPNENLRREVFMDRALLSSGLFKNERLLEMALEFSGDTSPVVRDIGHHLLSRPQIIEAMDASLNLALLQRGDLPLATRAELLSVGTYLRRKLPTDEILSRQIEEISTLPDSVSDQNAAEAIGSIKSTLKLLGGADYKNTRRDQLQRMHAAGDALAARRRDAGRETFQLERYNHPNQP